MKKSLFLVLLLSCFLTLPTLAKGSDINTISDLIGKTIGGIYPVSSEESALADIITSIGGKPGEVVYYNRTTDGITALMFEKIDAMLVSEITADFYLKRSKLLKNVERENRVKFNIVMGLRAEDSELSDIIGSAITTLEENGKLKELSEKWVTNFPIQGAPAFRAIPKIEGAKTLYVGVSGDVPPLDYMGADGRPAGFNVALLTEISRMLNINFKFVSIESPSRFVALKSKKIDLIFCEFQADLAFTNELSNTGWIVTRPYYSFDGVGYLVKK